MLPFYLIEMEIQSNETNSFIKNLSKDSLLRTTLLLSLATKSKTWRESRQRVCLSFTKRIEKDLLIYVYTHNTGTSLTRRMQNRQIRMAVMNDERQHV